ncbi:MAG: hypothetical protein JWR69_820, partial [Pedosphaera sp.]|nr:hypothetical protein [Pedosphaera sp.]
MTDWTNSAKTELERYCARVRESLTGSGADPAEVIDDLQRHVDTEVQAAQLRIVTEDDVRRILARLGEPPLPKGKPLLPADVAPVSMPQKPKRKQPGYTVLLLGTIFPIITLLIELITRMCASMFFDPLPTIWHVLVVAFVPLANLAAWISVRENKVARRGKLGLANAFALGISICYVLMFVPLMIPAFFAVIIFGWGLLPLCP